MSRDETKGREHLVARQVALTAVFKRFAVAWPRAFGASQWPVIMDTWNDQLTNVDTSVLEQAAREYMRNHGHQYPPKPWDFARIARQFSTKHTGVVQGPGAAPKRRVWEWISPWSKRICRVEEWDDGFVCSNLDSQFEFDALTAAGKVEFCERMVCEHADFLAVKSA